MRRSLIILSTLFPLAACSIPEEGDRPTVYGGGPAVYGPSGWDLGSRRDPYGYRRPGWGASPWSHGEPRNGAFRPERRVVCDRGTQVCYKRGEIDKSSTEDYFGERAGRRADRYRDRFGDDVIVRGRNSYCDRGDRVCYKNGHPDRSDTRDTFGKKAARRID
jgi:hypothetical protein